MLCRALGVVVDDPEAGVEADRLTGQDCFGFEQGEDIVEQGIHRPLRSLYPPSATRCGRAGPSHRAAARRGTSNRPRPLERGRFEATTLALWGSPRRRPVMQRVP